MYTVHVHVLNSGAVPVGGFSQIYMHLTPNVEAKFDTQIEIQIRDQHSSQHFKSQGIRIGGQSELPAVGIDLDRFEFGGVYTGSVHSLLFTMVNKLQSRVKATFVLTRQKDFSLRLAQQTEHEYGTCIL